MSDEVGFIERITADAGIARHYALVFDDRDSLDTLDEAVYAAHGISDMRLVDLRGRRLVRYRAPQQGAYSLVDEPGLGAPLEVSALGGVAVDLQIPFGT